MTTELSQIADGTLLAGLNISDANKIGKTTYKLIRVSEDGSKTEEFNTIEIEEKTDSQGDKAYDITLNTLSGVITVRAVRDVVRGVAAAVRQAGVVLPPPARAIIVLGATAVLVTTGPANPNDLFLDSKEAIDPLLKQLYYVTPDDALDALVEFEVNRLRAQFYLENIIESSASSVFEGIRDFLSSATAGAKSALDEFTASIDDFGSTISLQKIPEANTFDVNVTLANQSSIDELALQELLSSQLGITYSVNRDTATDPTGTPNADTVNIANFQTESFDAGSGDDNVTANESDFVIGGDGFDTLTLIDVEEDGLKIDATDSQFESFILDESADTFLFEGNADITVVANDGDDIITSGSGADNIFGNAGNDKLYGEDGNDVLNAGDGFNTLDGGSGDNILIGGVDKDTFELTSKTGIDAIQGGDGTEDTVNIRAGASGRISNLSGIEIINGDVVRGSVLRFSASSVFVGPPLLDLRTTTANGITRFQSEISTATIFGSNAADVLAGQGFLSGNGGNDTIYGTSALDSHIVGGEGNDTIIGKGQFTYNLGDGNDTVRMGAGSTIIIGSSIDPFSITLASQNRNSSLPYDPNGNNDLSSRDIILNMPDGGKIIVEDYEDVNFHFDANPNIDLFDIRDQQEFELGENGFIVFTPIPDNGRTISLQPTNGDDILRALPTGELISALGGNDTLISGLSDDVLQGGVGDDVYTYAIGSGHDVIEDIGGDDTLQFGLGIGPNDLTFTQENNDLRIWVEDSGSVLIRNWFTETDKPINTITFDGYQGTEYDVDDILILLRTIYDNSGNQSLAGDAQDNIFQLEGGNDTAAGGAGDDSYNFATDAVNEVTITETFDLGSFNTVNFASSTATGLNAFRDGFDLVVETNDGAQRSVIAGVFALGLFDPNNPALNIAEFTLAGQTLTGAQALEMARTLTGTNQADSVQGFINQNDVITGLDGNDFLSGDGGNQITGGDDNIDGGAGNDFISGDAGNDTLQGGADNDRIDGGTGDDTLMGGTGDDRLDGGLGTDTLDGGTGNDLLITDGQGADILDGGADDDTLILRGSTSGGSFIGGTGRDVFAITESISSVTINLANATVLAGSGIISTITGVEDIAITASTTNITGDALDNIISLTGGADVVDGGGGADQISTGDFADIITVHGSEVLIDGGSGFDRVRIASALGATLDLNNPVFLNIEEVEGNDGDDTIIGDSAANTLQGGLGADVISGGAGNDWLQGEGGNDILHGDAGDDSITAGDGDDIIYTGTGADSVSAGAGNDTIYAEGGNNYIAATSGNDEVFATQSDDVRGGDGIDTLRVNSADDFAGLMQGFEYAYGGAGDDSLRATGAQAIEYDGGAGDDSLSGNSSQDLSDLLRGGAGNDLVRGFGGDDTLFGDDGDDRVIGGDGADQLFGGTGIDILEGDQGNDTIEGGAGNDRLFGDEGDDTLYGQAGDDEINGGDGNDTIEDLEGNNTSIRGGAGNDSITTGSGDDIIFGDEGDDIITDLGGSNLIEGGAGNDTITSLGSEFNNLRGGDGNDTITGGAGINSITGGFGDDTIFASAGNDTIDGGDGFDVLSYADFADSLQIDLAAGTVTKGGIETDQITGIEEVIGGQGNDIITGTNAVPLFPGIPILVGGEDTLTGGKGDDTLQGGSGNDTYKYTLGDGNDTIIENTFAGAETNSIAIDGLGAPLSSVISGYEISGLDLVIRMNDGAGITVRDFWTDVNRTVDQITSADGLEVISAADIVNTLTSEGKLVDGTNIDDVLTGGAGDQQVVGYFGNDTLAGGTGDDALIGGFGDDTYVFNVGDGNDRILDFENPLVVGDNFNKVELGTGITTDNTLFSQEGLDLKLTFTDSPGDSLLIRSWFAPAFGGSEFNTIDEFIFDGGLGATVLKADIPQVLAMGGSAPTTPIIITDGDGEITGGFGDDQITSGGGDDTINAGNGDDTVDAGSGNNIIDAGEGNNDVSSGSGVDTITAGSGDDAINSGGGDDVINAGDGLNTIYGKGGNDSITTGSGADVIFSGTGDDIIFSGEGDDQIVSDKGDDTIDAGNGNNNIQAGNGNDNITTGSGDDFINAGADDDIINAGDGNNTVYGKQGNDNITTGSGDDLIVGADGNDFIVAGAGNDEVNAGNDNDFILGLDGNDTLRGDAGQDTLIGGTGDDFLAGGDDNDIYEFGRGDNQDTIRETGGLGDNLNFQLGIDYDQLWFTQSGQDLNISVVGTSDGVTIENWYANPDRVVEVISTANGDTLGSNDVDLLVQAMAAFNPPAMGQTEIDQATLDQLAPTLASTWQQASV